MSRRCLARPRISFTAPPAGRAFILRPISASTTLGIWRLPVAGGDETPVLDKHRAGLWRQWAVVEQGIFFITAERPEHPVIEFFRFADRSVTPVMTLDKRLPDTLSGLAVSPDGRRLIWAQLDHISSDISLIENFH